jgi:hypothetical protein
VETFDGIDNMNVFDFVLNPTTGKTTSVNYRKSKYWYVVREDEIGYMGNEAVGLTTVYNKCLLVGFSKSLAKYFRFDSLLPNDVVGALKELLMNHAMKYPIDNEFLQKLDKFLTGEQAIRAYYDLDDIWSSFIELLDKIGDVTWILKFIDADLIDRDKNTEFIADWLIKYGFENMMPSLKKIIRPNNLSQFLHITKVNLKHLILL